MRVENSAAAAKDGTQRAVIQASYNTVRNILIDIKERFELRDIKPVFLRPYLTHYAIPVSEDNGGGGGVDDDRQDGPTGGFLTPPQSRSSLETDGRHHQPSPAALTWPEQAGVGQSAAGPSPPQLGSGQLGRRQILPPKTGLVPLTQHRLRPDFMHLQQQQQHLSVLSCGLLPGELVMFLEMCSCLPGCQYGAFR